MGRYPATVRGERGGAVTGRGDVRFLHQRFGEPVGDGRSVPPATAPVRAEQCAAPFVRGCEYRDSGRNALRRSSTGVRLAILPG